MKKNSKLVFLDFDGVLVNGRSWYVRDGDHAAADPPCVAALNRITDAANASIVVSSAWRVGTKVAELRNILTGWGVKAPVIDKTPHFRFGADRGLEIKHWLANYPKTVPSFVILDDNCIRALRHRLVLTDFDPGLTQADASRAIAMLDVPTKPSELTSDITSDNLALWLR